MLSSFNENFGKPENNFPSFQTTYFGCAGRSPAQTEQTFAVISRNLLSLGTNLSPLSIGQLGHGLHWLFQ
jgi:hypothetical protein